jgi:hypothetical protein
MFRPLILILLASTVAMAGQERGGATVVVCFDKADRMKWIKESDCKTDVNGIRVCRLSDKFFDPKHPEYIQILELVDLYEAKMKRTTKAITPRIIETDENEELPAYVNRLLQRMDNYISPLATILTSGMYLVNNYKMNTAPISLPQIIDLGIAPPIDESKCVFSNLIIQYDIGPNIQVQVDERLMDHPAHKPTSKKLAWVHEYLYSYLRTYKANKTSVGTRAALKYLATEFPVYDVSGVVSEMLSLQVLPMIDPPMSDGYMVDGRRPDQVSTYEEQLAQEFIHFLDQFSHPVVLGMGSNDMQVQTAIGMHSASFQKIPNMTPEMFLYLRVQLYNVMSTRYDHSMLVVNSQFGNRELSPKARRDLTINFFKTFYPTINIPMR